MGLPPTMYTAPAAHLSSSSVPGHADLGFHWIPLIVLILQEGIIEKELFVKAACWIIASQGSEPGSPDTWSFSQWISEYFIFSKTL